MAPPLQVTPQHPAEVIVILGCRVHRGRPEGALERRLLTAAQLRETTPLPVIMSGGKSWDGVKECDAMEQWWSAHGLAGTLVFTEGKSTTTRENAAQVAILCEQLRVRHVVLVTCDFHMSRAQSLFRKFGLEVTEAPALASRSRTASLKLLLREWGARALDPWAALLKKNGGSP